MEVSGQLHVPAALPQGKSPRYPLDKRPDGPYNLFGRRGEEKIFAPYRASKPNPFVVQTVASSYTDFFVC
jgi:hypothetical protein